MCPGAGASAAILPQTSRSNCVGIAMMYLSEKSRDSRSPVVAAIFTGNAVSKKQKLFLWLPFIVSACLPSIVHIFTLWPREARCTAMAVPKLPAPRIVMFNVVPPFSILMPRMPRILLL